MSANALLLPSLPEPTRSLNPANTLSSPSQISSLSLGFSLGAGVLGLGGLGQYSLGRKKLTCVRGAAHFQQKGTTYARDGVRFHERDLLEYVIAKSTLGDAKSVYERIDEFCYTFGWAMNTGDVKGIIVDKVISDRKPKLVLELGGYVGYSAVRFGHVQCAALGGSTNEALPLYLSVELDPLMAAIGTKLVEHAGLGDTVKVLIGTLSTTADRIKSIVAKHTGSEHQPFDMIYIDHWKDQYVPDFLKLEELGFIGKGTVVVADNIINPGVPDYLKLLTEGRKENYESELIESNVEYFPSERDAILISIRK